MSNSGKKAVVGLVVGLTLEDTTACTEILGRLKQISNTNSDTALARILGLKQSSISTAKTRGMIPSAWIINASSLFNISADWLIYGDKKYPGKTPQQPTEKPQQTPPPPERQEAEIAPIYNQIAEELALDLEPERFKELWDQYWDEKKVRRGWLQVEVIKRFPEFLEWREQRGERLIMPHPSTLKRAGMVNQMVGVMGLEDE